MKRWQCIFPVLFLLLLSCSSVRKPTFSFVGTKWGVESENKSVGETINFISNNTAIHISKSRINSNHVYDTVMLKYKIKGNKIVLFPKKQKGQSWDKEMYPLRGKIEGDNLSFTYKKDPDNVYIIKRQKQ